jgi:hypothetical protein
LKKPAAAPSCSADKPGAGISKTLAGYMAYCRGVLLSAVSYLVRVSDKPSLGIPAVECHAQFGPPRCPVISEVCTFPRCGARHTACARSGQQGNCGSWLPRLKAGFKS